MQSKAQVKRIMRLQSNLRQLQKLQEILLSRNDLQHLNEATKTLWNERLENVSVFIEEIFHKEAFGLKGLTQQVHLISFIPLPSDFE